MPPTGTRRREREGSPARTRPVPRAATRSIRRGDSRCAWLLRGLDARQQVGGERRAHHVDRTLASHLAREMDDDVGAKMQHQPGRHPGLAEVEPMPGDASAWRLVVAANCVGVDAGRQTVEDASADHPAGARHEDARAGESSHRRRVVPSTALSRPGPEGRRRCGRRGPSRSTARRRPRPGAPRWARSRGRTPGPGSGS